MVFDPLEPLRRDASRVAKSLAGSEKLPVANPMTALFAEYKKLKEQRGQAWDMVFAVTGSEAREKLTRGAEELDRRFDNVMREINRLADELGVRTKRKGGR